MNVPWDMAFVYNDIDASLANWCDLFLSTVSDMCPSGVLRIPVTTPGLMMNY
jgi:hypothetical protein